MDSWRLSKIEEELERVESPQVPDEEFPPPPVEYGSLEWPKSRDQSPFGTLERPKSRDQSPFGTLERPKSRDQSPFGTLERLKYAPAAGAMERGRSMTPSGTLERSQTPSGTLERRGRSLTPSGTLERSHSFSNTVDSRDVCEEIYSKIVVKKGYSREDMEQEAIKHFTGKYESLGKVMLGAMSPKQEVKYIKGAHEEDQTLPTVFPEPIAPIPPSSPSPQLKSPTSPQLRSPVSPVVSPVCPTSPTSPTTPTSPAIRRDVIRPRSKPPPLPPSVPQSPSSPQSPFPPSRPTSASTSNTAGVRSSHRQSQSSRAAEVEVRRAHSQSSCQRQPLPQQVEQQQAGAGAASLRKPPSSGATTLTDADVTQVEMFYRSHKTEVFVCQCMANLYEGSIRSSPASKAGDPPARAVEIWNYIKPGIPVFVLDSGESRRNRKLSIMLSERGTGFPLWKETMSHLTNYRAEKATFHTLHLTNDHTKMMALSFDDPVAANEFVHILQNIVSNPDDDVLNLSGRSKKRKDVKKKPKPKYKAPDKADISSPCCFTHVTNLSSSDGVPKVAGPTPPPPSRNSGGAATSPVTNLPNQRSKPMT